MLTGNKHNGFAIALAWPKTYCKQAGAWYEPVMRLLGFNRNGYYKAGHAAILLVEDDTGTCHYYDFGRYHAPYQQGRVRSADTDPELKMKTYAVVRNNQIINLKPILKEVAERKACHGSGDLHASLCRVNIDAALARAKDMQQVSPHHYGPFIIGGTNCSRFVHSILLAGKPRLLPRLKLLVPYTFSPSPLSNVLALNNRITIPITGSVNVPSQAAPNGVLPEPIRPANLPESAQWLSGEGAGSWFHLEKDWDQFIITRYSDDGNIEYKAMYANSGNNKFDITKSFRLVHLSHYLKVNVFQSGIIYKLQPTGVKLTRLIQDKTLNNDDILLKNTDFQ